VIEPSVLPRWSPDRKKFFALLGIAVAIGGAVLLGFSLTPPTSVCNSGTVTLDVPASEYGTKDPCGPISVSSQYTYGFNLSPNSSIDFYLIEGRQLFNESVNGHPCCNVSYAQAFISLYPQDIGYQVRLPPSLLNFTYTPGTNTSIILVLLNTASQSVRLKLVSTLFYQTSPVELYLLGGLILVPAGIVLFLPHLLARRRREIMLSQQEIKPPT
jgi:hypothetical protein